MFTPWCCRAGGPAHDPRLHPILALHLTHHDRPHQTLHKRAPINPKATDTPTGGCRTHPFVAFRLGVGSVRSFGISRGSDTGPAEGVALVRWTSGPGRRFCQPHSQGRTAGPRTASPARHPTPRPTKTRRRSPQRVPQPPTPLIHERKPPYIGMDFTATRHPATSSTALTRWARRHRPAPCLVDPPSISSFRRPMEPRRSRTAPDGSPQRLTSTQSGSCCGAWHSAMTALECTTTTTPHPIRGAVLLELASKA